MQGGVNDWLAGGVLGQSFDVRSTNSTILRDLASSQKGSVHPIDEDKPEAGGRIVKFTQGSYVSVAALVAQIKSHLGLKYGMFSSSKISPWP